MTSGLHGLPLTATALCCGVLLLSGCDESNATAPIGDPDHEAAVAMQAVIDGIDQKQYGVLWDALPKSFQGDVERLLEQISTKIDPGLYASSMAAVERSVQLIDKHPSLFTQVSGMTLATTAAPSEAELRGMIGYVRALLDSPLRTHAGVTGSEPSELFGEVIGQYLEFSREAQGAASDVLRGVKASAVELGDGRADIVMSKIGAQPTKLTVEQIDGTWFPVQLAESWRSGFNQIGRFLLGFSQVDDKTLAQIRERMDLVTPKLEEALAAESAEAAQAILDQLRKDMQPDAVPTGDGR